MESLEERFWSKVWRCEHHWPCKKCCWPWPGVKLDNFPWIVLHTYGRFSDPRLDNGLAIPAHRQAFIFTHKTLLLPGIIICHQCDFAPCCNPAHLRAGSITDNMRDLRGKRHDGSGRRLVILPDSRTFSPVQIAIEKQAFYALHRALGDVMEASSAWVTTIKRYQAYRGAKHEGRIGDTAQALYADVTAILEWQKSK
jgi:hypothetical protein